MILSDLGI